MRKVVIAVLILFSAVAGYWFFVYDSSPKSPTNTQANESAVQANAIDYSGKGINSVPKNVLENSSATSLDVSNNKLTGALPAEIRKLSSLEILNASNNKMTGIPAEIGQLAKLKSVNYANNNISGLPLEIGNLTHLETLDLRGNPNISKYDISLIQTKIPEAKILVD